MGPIRNENPAGGMYHVYARGNNGRDLFVDDADRLMYLRLLENVVGRSSWALLAYCLMTNHVHLIIETAKADLGWGMGLLHGRFARAFNRRHRRFGHLFQGRFGCRVIQDDGHLAMTVRYVALNPVEAGLARRPEDWAWSSCAGTLGGTAARWLAVERLLGHFEWLGGQPRRRYAELVAPA